MLTTIPTTTTVLRRGEDISMLLVVERAARGRVRHRAGPLGGRSSILRHAVGDRPRVLLLCYHIPPRPSPCDRQAALRGLSAWETPNGQRHVCRFWSCPSTPVM